MTIEYEDRIIRKKYRIGLHIGCSAGTIGNYVLSSHIPADAKLTEMEEFDDGRIAMLFESEAIDDTQTG